MMWEYKQCRQHHLGARSAPGVLNPQYLGAHLVLRATLWGRYSWVLVLW